MRLLSGIGSQYYYSAKKHALDKAAAAELAGGDYDLFHGWSGECVRTLTEAKKRGVPSVIEIPTWHRHKGKVKAPRLTKSERERAESGGWTGVKNRLLVTRQQVLEEYDLADLILVLSEKAEETFLAAGVPAEKLFRHHRGVNVERFTPPEKVPEIFRAVFVGALIQRKGVHHLLEVWHRLNLKDAELVLVGSLHDEMRPWLDEFGGDKVRLAGFVAKVEDCYREATVHVFPSSCEGSAKATYEAAACGLPLVATDVPGCREVCRDGINGLLVPARDANALAVAIVRLLDDPALRSAMGQKSREIVVAEFSEARVIAETLAVYALAQAATPHA